jgi:hypothetical protein
MQLLQWLLDNWQSVVLLLYAIERMTAARSEGKSRIAALMDVINRQHTLSGGLASEVCPTAKEMMPEEFQGDTLLDIVLDDAVEPKETKRVNKRRRAAGIALRALPLLSRLLDRKNSR